MKRTLAFAAAAFACVMPALADDVDEMTAKDLVAKLGANPVALVAQYQQGKRAMALEAYIHEVGTITTAEGKSLARVNLGRHFGPERPDHSTWVAGNLDVSLEMVCYAPLDVAANLEKGRRMRVVANVADIRTHQRWNQLLKVGDRVTRIEAYPCTFTPAGGPAEDAPATQAAVSAPPTAETLCSAQETVVFACNTGKKLVSICASADFNEAAGTLQYRFGPKGSPEMVWPENPTSRQGITAGTLEFAVGGAAFIRFAKGATRHVVYAGEGRGWAKEGVVVEQNGKRVADLPCKGQSAGDLSVSGLPDDAEGFDIPQ